MDHHLMVSVFSILGAIVISLVYLAPAPTFYKIVRKKSAEGFPPIQYSSALFSAMLTLYYAYLKTNALVLICINLFGSFTEIMYLIMYMIYAPQNDKIFTAKLLGLFNFLVFGLILLGTILIPNDMLRLQVVGWIKVVSNVFMFASPLSIMMRVNKTKSVEHISFPLSFCLTLCAVTWFVYGVLIRDYFIAGPNILGFVLGIAQMILYVLMYKNTKNILSETTELAGNQGGGLDLVIY